MVVLPWKAQIDAPGTVHHIKTSLAGKLGISHPAVSIAVRRGERIGSENGLSIVKT